MISELVEGETYQGKTTNMRSAVVNNLRFLGLISLSGLISYSFAQDVQTPKKAKASQAFELAVKAEALAAEHPQDKNLCMKFEESLNHLIDHGFDDEMFRPSNLDLFARNMIARTSVGSPPRILTSFAPVFPWVLPENTPKSKPNRPEYSTEPFSKFIVYRCLSDRQFESQYFHLLLWSGRFVRLSERANQAYELALLMDHLKSPHAFDEGTYWSSLHQLFILTRLLSFREDAAFPENQAAATAWAEELAEWALVQKFKLSTDGLRWQSVGARDSNEPGIDLAPMKLPSVPMPDVWDWPFESLRNWANQY